MIRFFIALWASKLYLFFGKLRGQELSDKAGFLANKLCPDFLKYIHKPKLVIGVTGTNGKSTVSNLIYNVLKNNYSVAFNKWDANMLSGHARCLIEAVNVFNKSTKDAAVLEMDELTTNISFKYINPTYVIVTNLCHDSIRRNAHPEYIFNKINEGCNNCDATLILNADDPISSFITSKNKKIFFSVHGSSNNNYNYKANDFNVCPKCGSKVIYEYRNYRHIGKFHCSECDFKSLNSDLIVQSIDTKKKEMNVKMKNKLATFPIISDSIFNIYNVVALIALFIELKMDLNTLKKEIKSLSIPTSRESIENYNGVELITYLTKGQNVSAASSVFEYIKDIKKKKQLILTLDEVYNSPTKMDTVTWIYESDFEFLNDPNIEKIIVASDRYLDYKLRLLLAGINSTKIICVPTENDTIKYLDLSGKSTIYILHDVDRISRAKKLRDKIKERIGEVK